MGNTTTTDSKGIDNFNVILVKKRPGKFLLSDELA